MTQALNYTVKAIGDLTAFAHDADSTSRDGFLYLARKLREAQVFVLPDQGAMLDRSKLRPELPGATFRPPFPVVALEYAAPVATARRTPGYTDARSSRRIALAWEWTNDFTPTARDWMPLVPSAGVVVASIAYFDEYGAWLPIAAGAHMAFDDNWQQLPGPDHVDAMVASGQISRAQAAANKFPISLVPFLPEAIAKAAQRIGIDAMADAITADLMDEVNAYTDLCYALACRNVAAERHQQPAALNKARHRAGKLPFVDFHVLKLTDASGASAALGGSAGGHGSPRSHLRRGHIRRLRHLAEDRVTWVNATMVKGRGFVDKVYAL